jgi:hypothetical protein
VRELQSVNPRGSLSLPPNRLPRVRLQLRSTWDPTTLTHHEHSAAFLDPTYYSVTAEAYAAYRPFQSDAASARALVERSWGSNCRAWTSNYTRCSYAIPMTTGAVCGANDAYDHCPDYASPQMAGGELFAQGPHTQCTRLPLYAALCALSSLHTISACTSRAHRVHSPPPHRIQSLDLYAPPPLTPPPILLQASCSFRGPSETRCTRGCAYV